jgi:hypothetical protein
MTHKQTCRRIWNFEGGALVEEKRHAGNKTVRIAPRLLSRDIFRLFQLYLGGGLGVRIFQKILPE